MVALHKYPGDLHMTKGKRCVWTGDGGRAELSELGAVNVGQLFQNRLVMEVSGVIRFAASTPVKVTVGCPFVVYAVRVNVPE